jgi:hypothetical protein
MERSPAPDTDSETAERKRRLRILGVLMLPLAAIGVFFRLLSPTAQGTDAYGNDHPASSQIPKFPSTGPNPDGKVTMADIEFVPVRRLVPGPFFAHIDASYAKGDLQLSNPGAEKPFWTGPIEKAKFVEDIADAVHTIWDRTGKVIWSNANERGKPDLLIQRSTSGQTEIHGKNGALLWSRPIPLSSGWTWSKSKGRGQVTIKIAGLTMEGRNGAFTITDSNKTRLWSGTLPTNPSVLFRYGNKYDYSGESGSESGQNIVRSVHVETEPLQITFSNSLGKVLGQRPFETIKDKTGQITKRGKLFREVNGNGVATDYRESQTVTRVFSATGPAPRER